GICRRLEPVVGGQLVPGELGDCGRDEIGDRGGEGVLEPGYGQLGRVECLIESGADGPSRMSQLDVLRMLG
ncbi:MAG TPA: hypothetical protein VN969_31715, partial [Streptosporangiaceae bacterium]|nr:hypothetical protein [Streptosporangiaceae bacterium]